MNRTIATVTQWAGRLTVILALLTLIWSFSDIISENSNPFGSALVRPNEYVQALSLSASLAVTGMLALGIGMMLERFNDE